MMLPFPSIAAEDFGRLTALTDEALFGACGVRVMFTGRTGGESVGEYATLNCGGHVGDDEAAVRANREHVCEAAGAAGVALVVPRQVHGTELVCIADASDAPTAAEAAQDGADGVIVGAQGVAALLNFADCLPLVIVSPSGRFAVVHAGWRGAVARIASKAARELARGDAFDASQFNAYIGPHIRQECFEVGEDVADRFRAEFGEVVIDASCHVSLAKAVSIDLTETGLVHERITDAGICTKCHADRYYSYRATNGACGRHAAFAVRLGEGCTVPQEKGRFDDCKATLRSRSCRAGARMP